MQQCDSNTNTQWTNNNLPCNDSNTKTRDHRCRNGACAGTPHSCLSCEMHDGRGCLPRDGYCVIQYSNQRTCFSLDQTKPGNPCQVSLTANKIGTFFILIEQRVRFIHWIGIYPLDKIIHSSYNRAQKSKCNSIYFEKGKTTQTVKLLS